MKTSRPFLALMCLLCAQVGLHAQTASTDSCNISLEQIRHNRALKSTKTVFIESQGSCKQNLDSIQSLMELYYIDQFRHSQDQIAPALMFMSRDANFAMGLGGTIRMRAWYGWNGNIPANGFCPYLIPMIPDPTQERKLDATPAGTSLVFTLFGRSRRLGKFLGIIEAKFDGYDRTNLKLGKAYVTVGNWTVGYAPTTFCDPSSIAPTIDGAGPNGKSTKTNVLVRYFHSFKSNWSVAGGLEIPKSNFDAGEETKVAKCSDYLPDVAALAQYKWGESHVRLSALARMMTYRSLEEQKNFNVAGWAVQASAKVDLTYQWQLFAQVNYGKGHSSYLNGLSIDNFDLVGKPGEPGRMYAPASLGFTLGTEWYFSPGVFASLTVGEDRLFLKKPQQDNAYRYGLYGAANIFWDITRRLQVGAEYLWGQRTDCSGAHKAADRVDVLFQLMF